MFTFATNSTRVEIPVDVKVFAPKHFKVTAQGWSDAGYSQFQLFTARAKDLGISREEWHAGNFPLVFTIDQPDINKLKFEFAGWESYKKWSYYVPGTLLKAEITTNENPS